MTPLNLTRLPLLGPLLRSPILQRTLQLSLLAGYVALVVLGQGRDVIPGVPDLHPRMYTHATTLLFWVVWLMGLVFLAPVAARSWCGVCPLGYATDTVGRRGLGLRWPRWIRDGWGTLAVFAGGLLAVVAWEAPRSPHRTAVLIGLAGGVALLSALIWRRSAFCRGLCPIGSVLYLYSRYAPLRILPRDPSGCRTCSGKGCVGRRSEWRRWDLGRWVFHRQVSRGGCPVALYPPDMDTGACLLCLRCVRSCPGGNLGLYWGGSGEDRPLDRARLGMLVVVLGLVGFALVRTWPWLKAALSAGWDPAGAVAGAWLVLGMPLALVGGPAAVAGVVARLRGSPAVAPGDGARPPAKEPRGTPRKGLPGRLLIPLVGPLLGGHAALALVKLNAKGGYLPYLFYDPEGASTYLAIHVAKVLPLPDLLVPLPWLRWGAVACFAVGVVSGLVAARKRWGGVPRWEAFPYAASFVAASALLGGCLGHWLF